MPQTEIAILMSLRNLHGTKPISYTTNTLVIAVVFYQKWWCFFFFFTKSKTSTFGLVKQLSLIQPFKSRHLCHFLPYIVYNPTNLLNFFFDFLLFDPSSLILEVDTGRWAGNSGRIGLPAEWSFQQRSSCTNLMQFIPRSKYFW